jgi:hypothetical protein
MSSTRLVLVLTVVNLGLLAWQAFPAREAGAKEDLPVLRGRGLEIVDGEGRVRAHLKIEPANPTYRWPDGSRVGYPETVILRLITPEGKPNVKMTASTEGAGLLLGGGVEECYVLAHAEGARTFVKVRNDPAHEKVLAP